jgi:lipopolysaccharide heptosyltransferase I
MPPTAPVCRAESRRILIVKPSSLGDVVHALPAVNLVRTQYPRAHIAWLINPEFKTILHRNPVIDSVIEFPRRNPAALPSLIRHLRRAQFDTVIDLQGLLRSGLLAFATGAHRRIGMSDSREGARLFHNEIVPVARCHAVDRYLAVAQHLGCPTSPVLFPLGIDLPARKENWIAVNPSARWATKLWGDDRFAELVKRLPRNRVVLTGSQADRARIDRIAHGCRNLAGQTTLLELADLYARCAVVVTNDTGPMHIAAAVGTPVVAIFGPTDPDLTGPYGTRHTVLRTGIPCSPCFRDRCRHVPHMECMSAISVDQVIDAIQPHASISA